MKVWEKRFKGRKTVPLLEKFNASIADDAFLYNAEIDASQAYASALQRAGVLTVAEEKTIRSGLRSVKRLLESGADLGGFEDIHSAVELLLTEEIGETGKKLHSGRSRNEQVVTVERLYLKEKIGEAQRLLRRIQFAAVTLAEEYDDLVMPGYTHLQQAQCLLFSHYILSLFWQMERGRERLQDALKRIDVLPLGSGALAGSSVALDREFLREQLGFASVSRNSLDTVADRSYILEALFAMSLVMLDLSRFAEDFVLFSSREFSFLKLDDSIATSSSLMPQKKNPDFFELIRGRAGRVYGCLTDLFITLKGLPMSYNKDLQEDKRPLYRGMEEAMEVLGVFAVTLTRIEPDVDSMRSRLHPDLLATDLVDYLMQKGVAFRDAHGVVGELVAEAQKMEKSIDALSLDEYKNFSTAFDSDVRQVFDFNLSLQRRRTEGSTHPERVREQLQQARQLLSVQG